MKTNNIIKISMTQVKFQTLIGLLATLTSEIVPSEITREIARDFLDETLTKNKRSSCKEENFPSHLIK